MDKFASLGALLFLVTAAHAETTTFYINDASRRDIVTFTSKAPLETVVGRTAQIKGYVSFEPTDISGTAQAEIEVDLASLDTGIGLRNKHMREQYLETHVYPSVVFNLVKVIEASSDTLTDAAPIQLLLRGKVSLHGVEKDVTVPVTVRYIKESSETKSRHPGDLMQITSKFDLLLSDFSIRRPQFIILQLDDRQEIYIDVYASTKLPAVTFAQ